MTQPREIAVGDRVRSFDFPANTHGLYFRPDCYIVGVVRSVDFLGDSGLLRYSIKVEQRIIAGEPTDITSSHVYPPINGTPTITGRTDGVVRDGAEADAYVARWTRTYTDRNGRTIDSSATTHVRCLSAAAGADCGVVIGLDGFDASDGPTAVLAMDHAETALTVKAHDLIVLPRERRDCARCRCAHQGTGACVCGNPAARSPAFAAHDRVWPCDGCGFDVKLGADDAPAHTLIYCGGDRCSRPRVS